MLNDAHTQRVRNVPPERGAEWAPRRYWKGPPDLMEEALAAPVSPMGEAIEAYVNEGRWVVDCPNCGGAQLACRTDRRFMCNECANVAIGGMWRPVVWPPRLDEIEVALDARRNLRTRNWVPGETPEGLRLEQQEREGRRG